MALPTRIKLIANPVAGGDARQKIARARVYLEGRGCLVDLTLTGARGDASKAAAAAREGGFDRILAAGGDGTLNEVVNGLAPSATPLAFLPLGTTNVFALEVGIPFDVERACAVALEGEPRPICLGMAGETRFILMAGVGFDAQVVSDVSLPLKRLTGKLAYVVSGLSLLATRRPEPLEVVDEEGNIHRGYGAILSNCRLYAGKTFSFTPQASLGVDRLDVCLLLNPGRLAMLGYAATVLQGRSPLPPGALCLQGREFTVRGKGIPVQIDGDFLGRLPMTFRSVFGEILFVLPKDRNTLEY